MEGGLFGIGMKVESHPPHFVQAINGLEVASPAHFYLRGWCWYQLTASSSLTLPLVCRI